MRTALIGLLALATLTGCEDAQKSTWGLDAIKTMKTPADDPNLGCGLQVPADTLGAQREACAFGSGARVSASLGIGTDVSAAIPIRHVIIMMKENRSFDHLLGKLHDRLPAAEAVPADYTNPDLSGQAVAPFHATTTCIPVDPTHQSANMIAGVNHGAMDGWVRNAAQTTGTDGHFAISYYDATDLPFDYFLASTFALNDSHFAPMASGTYGNRAFFMLGTNAGVVDTGIVYPSPNTPSIFHLLMNAGFTWGAYSDANGPSVGAFDGTLDWRATDPGVHTIQDLLDALDNGTLPNVAFVDGIDSVDDDHPTADVQVGEAWTKRIYDHAIASPQWQRLAIFWTYDEGGAFADHMVPGKACAPSPGNPFTDQGPRVPFAAVSPWAKRGYVSHVRQDHTAMTRFIETVFDLPALTARDANSTALLDLFDFTCGRDLSVPVAPAAGTGGCTK